MAETATLASTKVTHLTVIINDQAKALDWYQRVLGAEVANDQIFDWEGHETRWLTVRLPGSDLELVLMPPMPSPDGTIPKAGDGPMVILHVDDCAAFVDHAKSCGVENVTEPESMPWGISAILRDVDGNPYNVVQPPE